MKWQRGQQDRESRPFPFTAGHADRAAHVQNVGARLKRTNAKAACDYLKDAKEKFGNWTVAAASYNLGRPSMAQRIKDQKSNNFYDMYFNPETSRYIFRMLAMKIIFSNHKRAGFNIKTEDLYQPYKYKIVEIDSGIHDIADFAAQHDLKYKHIKILNTWLREAQLTNKERRKYQIRILEMN